jgi:CRP-like cAMP-binding protein
MPMSLNEEIHLLSMVDILGPLSDEELEDLARRSPDTFLEQGDVLYTPKDGTERLFILKEGRVQCYEIDRGGEEITLSVVEGGNVFGEMALTGQSLAGFPRLSRGLPGDASQSRRQQSPGRCSSVESVGAGRTKNPSVRILLDENVDRWLKWGFTGGRPRR